MAGVRRQPGGYRPRDAGPCLGVEKIPLPEYIRWVAANALKFHEVEFSVQGATDEEMAASLIGEMIRSGLSWSV